MMQVYVCDPFGWYYKEKQKRKYGNFVCYAFFDYAG